MNENAEPIRLTEDLLYIVNKKLESRDIKERNEAFDDDRSLQASIFAGVTGYRSTNVSQTEKAVMHKLFFDQNSIASCDLDSTENLMAVIQRFQLFDYCKNFDVPTPCQVGFIKLPGDFLQPDKNCIEPCTLFKELAWKEKDMILIDAKQFTECILIRRLKLWLENSAKSYPIECNMKNPPCLVAQTCRCRNIFRVATFMTENFVHSFGLQNIRAQTEMRLSGLPAISRALLRNCKKLMTGKELISESNRAENVLLAMQLRLLADKVDRAHSCLAKYEFSKTRGLAIGNPLVEL